MVKYLIIACIVVYCGWVIYRKLSDVKQGKFCGCDCLKCARNCGKKK